MTTRASGAVRAGALTVLATAALYGCGDDTVNEGATVGGVGPERVGSVAQLAQCADWRDGTVDERLATIDDIRDQVTQEGTVNNPELSDDRAYELFQDACTEDYAAGFRLYKIYNRAAAFSALLPADER